MTEKDFDRRSFLKFGGSTAVAVSLAGCSGGGDGTGTEEPTDTEMDDGTPMDDETDTASPTPADPGEDTSTPTQEDFEVTITQGNMPSGLDPHDHRETPTDVVMLHAYEGVLTRDASGAMIQALATGFSRIDGEDAVRFEIREDVPFHNGDTLEPADVAYSINRIVRRNGRSSHQR